MLLTKEVEVSLVGRNINYYHQIGLITDRSKRKIIIPIEKLSPKSVVEIDIECDYCKKQFKRKYAVHTSIRDKNYNVTKDACWNCNGKKQQEERNTKIEEINKLEHNGYWSFKQNRMAELDEYINNYKNIDSLYTLNNELYRAFKRHNHDILEATKELGFNIYDVMTKFPQGYYDDLENVLKRIKYFIKTFGKFPTQQEMSKTLCLNSNQIKKHGGIGSLKKILNIEDNLKDDNGFYNSSSYEYCVAQYLIHNTNINYLREQHPFPPHEGKFRSDFMFALENNERVHIEVWGNIGDNYEEVKNKKIDLYNKYNIKMISMESSLFYCKMDTIQDKLYEILSPFINLKTLKIDGTLLYNYDSLTDKELLEEIMTYSTNEKMLPSSKLLKDMGKYCLYHSASKRYGSYHGFGKCMGLNTEKKSQGYWDTPNLYKEVLKVLLSGTALDRASLRNGKLANIDAAISKYAGGIIQFRLDFYDLRLKELNYKLIDSERQFIIKVSENKGTNIKGKVSKEQMELAQNIIRRIDAS